MYQIMNVDGFEEIAKIHKLPSLVAKVMVANNYQFDDKEELKNPFDYQGMKEFTNKIKEVIQQNKKIVIYGDYDADGVCATTILVKTFAYLNKEVGYYIPNRYLDGYGLNKKMIEKFSLKNYDLIIAVDCGIKNNEEIEYAKSKGIEVMVIDHHQAGEIIPSVSFLHPILSSFVDYNMSASSISFFLSIALLGRIDEYLLSLAGISTISDVMPLIGQNRLLAKEALSILTRKHYDNLDLLCEYPSVYDEKTLSFNLIPKLNAVGRIGKNNEANLLVKYLKEEKVNSDIYDLINKMNSLRKEKTKSDFMRLDNVEINKIVLVSDNNLDEGLCGIIASSFTNKYKVPSIILTESEDKDIYKGSARSFGDFSIIDLLNDHKDYLEAYGGHQGAAGLSIKKEKINDFFESIRLYMNNINIKKHFYQVIEVNQDEITLESYHKLLELGPFGEGNNEPLFLLKNIEHKMTNLSRDGRHVLINFRYDLSLVAYDSASKLNHQAYDFIFAIEKNNIKNDALTLKCRDFYPSKSVNNNNE